MVDVKRLEQEIREFLKANALDTDVSFYSPEEWADRREVYGKGALFTIAFEGALYDVINYPSGSNTALASQFGAIAEKHGAYYELGYAWSAHFYPIY